MDERMNQTKCVCMHASVWLAARLVASLYRILSCHGLKRACRKIGTE